MAGEGEGVSLALNEPPPPPDPPLNLKNVLKHLSNSFNILFVVSRLEVFLTSVESPSIDRHTLPNKIHSSSFG